MCLDGAMGVAIAKKLTTKQLSKQLVDCKQKELLEIITELYSACPDACDYLNIRFGDEGYKSAMLADATKKVRGGFYTRGGRAKLALPQAKDAVKWFSGICSDKYSVIDLKLTFVEYAADIAVNYYNLPSSFFRDADNMFISIVNTLNECTDRSVFDAFDERMKKLIISSIGADGGMHDSLESMYDRIKWIGDADNDKTNGLCEHLLKSMV